VIVLIFIKSPFFLFILFRESRKPWTS